MQRSRRFWMLLLLLVWSGLVTSAQTSRIAFYSPSEGIQGYCASLENRLSGSFKIADRSMVETAVNASHIENIFNLSREESRRLGASIGVERFVLMRTAKQRRAEIDGPGYIEAFAVYYVVDTRSGALAAFGLKSVRGDTDEAAEKALFAESGNIAADIENALRISRSRLDVPLPAGAIEMPETGEFDPNRLKLPIPYRRIKPAYPQLASLYAVAATIEIQVDIDADGRIVSTSIEKWAGFGLEESVENAVRAMSWRPAMRDGKPLAMRVLLRYNFAKIEKDEES